MAQRFRIPHFLTVIFIVALQSCHSPAKGVGEEYYPVTKVVDGDTFWVDDGTRKGRKVRLIGVDAPETRRTGRKEIGYYADESKRYLTNLLLNRAVRLEY